MAKYCDLCGREIKRTINHTDYSFNHKLYCSPDCRMAMDYLHQSLSLMKKVGIKVNLLRFEDKTLTVYLKV